MLQISGVEDVANEEIMDYFLGTMRSRALERYQARVIPREEISLLDCLDAFFGTCTTEEVRGLDITFLL